MCGIPQLPNITTFVDDAAFLSWSDDADEASSQLQEQQDSTNTWLTVINESEYFSKLQHINSSLRYGNCTSVKLGKVKLL